MFDGFLNPGLAAGALLCAVPLLIHLLNRQRYKPMQWAAMRFVLAAYEQTRRRARLENLLLLLLRMGAVALLAFAVARPFAGKDSPFAGMTESRRDMVLVLDGSASTAYREEVRTVFEKITERARELLLELDGGRGDRVRLVYAGAWPRLLSWRSPEEALEWLNTLSAPTDEALDLAEVFGEILRYAEQDGGPQPDLEVRLLTDLQNVSFSPTLSDPGAQSDDADVKPLLVEQLDQIAELGMKVLVEDLGPPLANPPNLGIVSLSTNDAITGPGVPVDVQVAVRNFGTNVKTGVRVVLEVDGQRRPHKLIEVPARGETEVVFSVVFRQRGEHTLVARLEADRLVLDDALARVVHVPPPLRVLLVNGDKKSAIDEDEVGLLSAVLQPLAGDEVGSETLSTPFEPREIEPHELDESGFDLGEFDVIWLANVDNLPSSTVERLEERVALGAALIFSLGDRIEAGRYNHTFFQSDGSGLLPAELTGVVTIPREESFFRVQDFEERHPALAFFADERWKGLLTEVPIYAFFASRPLALPGTVDDNLGAAPDEDLGADASEDGGGAGRARFSGVRVLAQMDDPDASPLLIERSYDLGRVFLWTTTIDPAWTRLPEWPPTMVPLVHELLRYAGTPREPKRNVTIGTPLVAEVEKFPRGIDVVLPDETRRRLEGETQPLGPRRYQLPPVTETDRAGLYKIELEGDQTLSFAVHADPREGDLERLPAGELGSIHRALVAVGSRPKSGSTGTDAPAQGELWRWLAGACLAFLVLESCWAAWIGHRRRKL